MKKKRITKLLIQIIALLFIPLYCVNAVTIGYYGPPSTGSVPIEPSTSDYTSGDRKFAYEYISTIDSRKTIETSIFNLGGEKIIDANDMVIKSTNAGTWAGIMIIEEQMATWNVSVTVSGEYKKEHNCTYSYYYTCYVTTTTATTSDTGTITATITTTTACLGSSTDTSTTNFGTSYTCPDLEAYGYYLQSHTTRTTTVSVDASTKETIRKKIIDEVVGKEAKATAKALVTTTISSTQYIAEDKYPKNSNATLNMSKLASLPIPMDAGYKDPPDDQYESGVFKRKYENRPYKVCMNAQTAKVRYITDDKNKECNDNEFDVTCSKEENGRCIWRYFNPLNTNTGNEFYIEIGNKNHILSKNECYYALVYYPIKENYTTMIYQDSDKHSFSGAIESDKKLVETIGGCYDKDGVRIKDVETCKNKMDENPNVIDYSKIITDLDGKPITGSAPSLLLDVNGNVIGPTMEELAASEAGKKVQNGCLFAEKIDLNVEQKFYGEKEEKNKRSIYGYNFYYRPIDVHNPFPNPLDEYSYWYGLEDTIGTEPFGTITYKLASTESTKNIRATVGNSLTKYTNWEGMKKDGSSEFVKTYGLKIGSQDYYKIGCGPVNEDWEECK